PTSNARAMQAAARSAPTPPPYVSHEPRLISDTERSLRPSLRYFMAGESYHQVALNSRRPRPVRPPQLREGPGPMRATIGADGSRALTGSDRAVVARRVRAAGRARDARATSDARCRGTWTVRVCPRAASWRRGLVVSAPAGGARAARGRTAGRCAPAAR